MNECLHCSSPVEWDKHSNICESCLEKEHGMQIKNPDRLVEDPGKSWF